MIYLGMDVHKDSITIAVLPQSAKAPTRLEARCASTLDGVMRPGLDAGPGSPTIE